MAPQSAWNRGPSHVSPGIHLTHDRSKIQHSRYNNIHQIKVYMITSLMNTIIWHSPKAIYMATEVYWLATKVLVWRHKSLAGLHNSQDWQDYGLARRSKWSKQVWPTKLAWHVRSVHWMYLQDNQKHNIQTGRRQGKYQAHATNYLISKHNMNLD